MAPPDSNPGTVPGNERPPPRHKAGDAFTGLARAITHGLTNIDPIPGDGGPTIVAAGLPVSAMQKTIRLSACIARQRFSSNLLSHVDGTLPPSDHAFLGLMSEGVTKRVLEDFRVEMAATSIGAISPTSIQVEAKAPSDDDRTESGGPSASPDLTPGVAIEPGATGSPDEQPAHTRSAAAPALNQPVPTDGWRIPNLRIAQGPGEGADAPVSLGEPQGRFPVRSPTNPPLLFVNGAMFSLVPGDTETPTSLGDREEWWTTALTTDPEEVAWHRQRYLSEWDQSRPVVSYSPDEDILLGAASTHISSEYSALLSTALSAPISQRSSRSRGRMGGRPPAPALLTPEALIVLAAFDGSATRKELTTFSEATKLTSDATLSRAQERLVEAGIIETAPDPTQPRGTSRAHVYQFAPAVEGELPSDAAKVLRYVGHQTYSALRE
jgi:hypothetical protein